MATQSSNRTPFSIAESARIVGGQLITRHGPSCHTHRGGDCGCLVVYALRRERKVRGR